MLDTTIDKTPARAPIAAVTGATGFIGREVAAQLLADGWRVRALARGTAGADRLLAMGASVVFGDLHESAALGRLCDGVDAVVHCAGAVRGAGYAEFKAVNVDGTARLLEALDASRARLVVLSSLAARRPLVSDYARSKKTMERLCADDESGRARLILRPPAVYGPGDRALGALFAVFNLGIAPLPAPPEARFSIIHVADLAAAIVAWLKSDQPVGGCYEIDDGQAGGYSWGELLTAAEPLCGRPIRGVRLPPLALAWVAAVNQRLARRLSYAPMFTPGKLRELRQTDWVSDSAPLRAVLDWQPRIRLAAGLATVLTRPGGRAPQPRRLSDDHAPRRNLSALERASAALYSGRTDDRATGEAGRRPGAGFGSGDGSAHGARGSARRLDTGELVAGRPDLRGSGAGDGAGDHMSLFDKFEPIARIRRDMAAQGIDPLGVPIDRVLSATEAVVRGRRTMLAGSNNYLGLTFDADCVSAAQNAVRELGTGTTGSRMANGSYDGHLALEREFAAFYGVAHAMVFSTGYQANLGILSALAGPQDVVMLDADCHASIYDGVKLGGAETLRFRHNNPADLDKRLRRLGARAADTLVVVEGIYSMLGDQAPLAELVAVVKAHGAMIFVDEAHSLGILGARGRGAVEAAGVIDDVDFIVGTFSKSLGAAGGFCVSRHAALDMVRYASRPYIFTASPVPSVVASVRVALSKLETRPELRGRLWHNAYRLHAGLTELGFTLGAEPGPVVAAMFAERDAALAFWQGLLDRGIYVNLMLPPATPGGQCLVRVSLSAAHTPAQIDRIITAFAELKHEQVTEMLEPA